MSLFGGSIDCEKISDDTAEIFNNPSNYADTCIDLIFYKNKKIFKFNLKIEILKEKLEKFDIFWIDEDNDDYELSTNLYQDYKQKKIKTEKSKCRRICGRQE